MSKKFFISPLIAPVAHSPADPGYGSGNNSGDGSGNGGFGMPNLQVQSVSQVANAVKRTVEQAFDRVRIRGEISRPTYARSGHLYLTLKDDKAVLDAVAWKGQAAKFGLRAEEGMEVIAEGRMTTYPGSSKYQLVMDRMEPAGQGALLKMLEDRRKKLAAEGLFDEVRKKPLPFMPRVIGVVTSPTGAVIRDILHRLRARFPVHVLVWPVAVQGKGAETAIAEAIRGFDAIGTIGGSGEIPRPDTLIVARGGGSLEDLWCFNGEDVVRAAAGCSIPLISAVGHETDTTLIDFASDVRAPTPTAAAELSVPVRESLITYLDETGMRARTAIRRTLADRRQSLEGLSRGLINPERALETLGQRLDELDRRLDSVTGRIIRTAAQKSDELNTRLPRALHRQWRNANRRLETLEPANRLPAALRRLVREKQRGLEGQYAKLKSFEQAETKALERGYARVWTTDGVLVTHTGALPDDKIELEFHDARRIFPSATAKPARPPKPKRKPEPKPEPSPKDQGSLF